MSRSREFARLIVPDFHGAHIDWAAAKACIRDAKSLRPKQVVLLGDGLDCAGTFSTHQRTYTNEMAESYDDDCRQANRFLNLLQNAAPDASFYYLEGNHEQHVERWAARTMQSQKDAENLLEVYGPEAVLELKERGIRYYKRSTHYMGLSIPGAIRLGKCFFVHGISHSKHAASVHLLRFGAPVVFGHVHRSASVIERTVMSEGHGAWSVGCLTKLQPLYAHTAPTSWTHGYGLQLVQPSGRFQHFNVSIHKGSSLMADLLRFAA